jgi:hypothetical protein
MGGLGSGRSSSYPTTLDDLQKIDLPYLRRKHLLTPGYSGSLRWSRGGREIVSIGFLVDHDRIMLRYRARDHGTGAWQDIVEPMLFLRTRQALGGERLWLACPGCGRGCAALYGGRRFRCRWCAGLPYASQHETRDDRLLSRAQDIRVRLGGSASLDEPFPGKPKGMHWKTYDRLRAVSERCAHISLMMAARRLGMPGGEPEDFLG